MLPTSSGLEKRRQFRYTLLAVDSLFG